MRKPLTIFALVLSLSAYSQNTTRSAIVLKNGTTLTGVVEDIDISKGGVTISIGGIKKVISMDEISSIEEKKDEKEILAKTDLKSSDDQKLEYGKAYITEKSDYPETTNIEVGGEIIEMVLVRGGDFLMGYDGPGSRRFDCEPIHKVTVSSFYVSKKAISNKLSNSLIGVPKKLKEKEINDDANLDWNEASEVINAMSKKTSRNLRMITEAEWEYLSLMSLAKDVLKVNTAWLAEWCYDYLSEYPSTPQVNPRGPEVGNKHVLRNTYKMDGEKKRWRLPTRGLFATVFRVVLDAKDLNLQK